MTPKEKAKELVDKFFEYTYRVKWDIDKNKWEHNFDQSKQCALIAIDEIIEWSSQWNGLHNEISFWQEVKTEIELL
jgi:hypothetical protein